MNNTENDKWILASVAVALITIIAVLLITCWTTTKGEIKMKKETDNKGFELKLDVLMNKPHQQLKATPKRAIPKQPRR